MVKYSLLSLWLFTYAGVLLQDAFGFAWLFLAIFGLALLACFWPKTPQFRPVILGTLALGFGGSLALFSADEKVNLPQDKNFHVQFYLEKKLNNSQNSRRYVVKIVGISGQNQKPQKAFLAMAYQPKSAADLRFGQIYQAQTQFKPLAGPQQPFLFNYQRYMARQGVGAQLYHWQLLANFPQEQGFLLWFKCRKQTFEDQLTHSPLSSKSQELIKALVLGDRSNLQSDISEDFTNAGLAHILAISGGHIMLVYYVFFWLFSYLFAYVFRFRKRAFAVFWALFFVWVYAALIDFGPSISRACLMLTLYFGFELFGRAPQALHALALSGLILLCIDHQQAFSVSYQLSYAAVLGIILCLPIFSRYIYSRNKMIENWLLIPLKISLAAQISTLPLVLYYFHQYPLISLLANVIFMLWSELLLMISGIYLFGYSFFEHFPWLGHVLDFLCRYTYQAIAWLANVPWQRLQNITCSGLEAFLLALTLLLAYVYALKKQLKWALYSGMTFLILAFVNLYLDYRSSQQTEHLALSWQGKSIIFHRHGRYLKVEMPPNIHREEVEKKLIQPYLWHIRTKTYAARNSAVLEE
jgi:competence protein ComEC